MRFAGGNSLFGNRIRGESCRHRKRIGYFSALYLGRIRANKMPVYKKYEEYALFRLDLRKGYEYNINCFIHKKRKTLSEMRKVFSENCKKSIIVG
jgi:hypothetical protein